MYSLGVKEVNLMDNMVNKGSFHYKTQDISFQKQNDLPLSKYKHARVENEINHEVPDEMNSGSKTEKMSKYIKNSYKPFEYQDKKLQSRKVKPKYFYPPQNSNNKMMNIQNFDNNMSVDYDEGKMRDMFEKQKNYQENIININTYNSKTFDNTKYNSNTRVNSGNRTALLNKSYNENKIKE